MSADNQPRFDPARPVDFVVIGSESAGGILAKELSTKGFDVVLLEQRPFRKSADFKEPTMSVKKPLLFCLAFFCAACQPASEDAAPEVEYLNTPGMEALDLPFSAAVRVDNTLYLSGAIGNIPGTMDLAPGGIRGQTRQTLENIKSTLEQFGSSMDRVVKCTVFLADMDEWEAMNEVYVTFFENPPARSAFGASGLALDGRLEIECIAVVD